MNTQLPKQVIIIRKDLNMRKGKMVAQGAHSSGGAVFQRGEIIEHFEVQEVGAIAPKDPVFYKKALVIPLDDGDPLTAWLEGIFTKICVSVNSEEELMAIHQKALDNGVNVKLIQDCGLTEFSGVPTYTGLTLGPDYPEKINPISGHLPLL